MNKEQCYELEKIHLGLESLRSVLLSIEYSTQVDIDKKYLGDSLGFVNTHFQDMLEQLENIVVSALAEGKNGGVA